MTASMSTAEVIAFLDREFPQLQEHGGTFRVEHAEHGFGRLRLVFHPRHLRPGGTISGPSMFALADVSLYVAVLASIGPVALAVTTHLAINFLRKPGPVDLIGEARLLKLGRRLAVGEVSIREASAGEPLVAHATGTYAIPDRKDPPSAGT